MKNLLALSVFISMTALSAHADMATEVEIDSPYARAAIVQQRNSAIFMTLKNQGSSGSLVAATSPAAHIVELHTHINDGGVMRMRKIPSMPLPSSKTVRLQPGGLHIMLLGLKQDLKPQDQIEATLTFSDGSEKTLQVPVKKMMMHKMKNMQQHRKDGSLPQVITH